MAACKTTTLIIGLLIVLITNTNISQSGMVTPYCGLGCWYSSGTQLHMLTAAYNGYNFESDKPKRTYEVHGHSMQAGGQAVL